MDHPVTRMPILNDVVLRLLKQMPSGIEHIPATVMHIKARTISHRLPRTKQIEHKNSTATLMSTAMASRLAR